MKKGLVNGFEITLNARATITLNLKNLLSMATSGMPNPNVGKTLMNVPIAAPSEISKVLALALASFRKNSFIFLNRIVFSISEIAFIFSRQQDVMVYLARASETV